MTLRKQIFISFIFVAILPLLFVMLYIFRSNTKLAFELYQQNLNNSTVIQTDIIEENMNRMIVRTANFAAALEKSGALNQDGDILKNPAASDAILHFTEDTLDSILVFTLFDRDGGVLYSSGSKSDTMLVMDRAAALSGTAGPAVSEIPMGDGTCHIAIIEPLKTDGILIVIYRNDFLLKTISSHVQIEESNAFFYCRNHNHVVTAKKPVNSGPGGFVIPEDRREGNEVWEIGGGKAEVYYKSISKTPWVLVNSMPVTQVYSHIFVYMVVNMLVFTLCLAVVIILSRIQSRRILQPMNWLLDSVERFMRDGKTDFSNEKVVKKSEVGFLAERFADMAADMAVVQAKLRESSYLYKAILDSSYDAYIAIDYNADTIETSLEDENFQSALKREGGEPQQILEYFLKNSLIDEAWNQHCLEDVICGRMKGPMEFDAGFLETGGTERWYRIMAVPVFGEDMRLHKMVLHLRNITEQKIEERRLRQSSQRDPLCSLLNKNALMELTGRRKPPENGLEAVFFIDLDKFKQVNDELGHLAGDDVLIQAAGIIKDTFRKTDLVCRYGGDEFVVFVSGISSGAVRQKADILTHNLHIVRKGTHGDTIVVTASIGVCISRAREKTENLIMRADKAMYEAKQSGRSQYCIDYADGENFVEETGEKAGE